MCITFIIVDNFVEIVDNYFTNVDNYVIINNVNIPERRKFAI